MEVQEDEDKDSRMGDNASRDQEMEQGLMAIMADEDEVKWMMTGNGLSNKIKKWMTESKVCAKS